MKEEEKELQEGKEAQEQQNFEREELSEELSVEDFEENDFEEVDFEDSEYEEEDLEEDDFGQEEGIVLKPWMIPAFAGMLILAILICIPLWGLTHRVKNTTPAGNGAKATTESVKDVLAETVTPEVPGTAEELAETSSAESASTEGAAGQLSESGAQLQEAATKESQAATAPVEPQEKAAPTSEPGTGAENEPVQEPVSGNASMSFQEVSDSVTAKDVTNLRSVPSTEDAENVVGQLKNGESLARTGVNSDTGWSRLSLNGETVYAVTQFLTTDLSYKTPVTPSNPNRVSTLDGRGIIFTDCNDNVTPKEYVNLRTEPSTSEGQSTVKCQVNNGESMHRTGYSSDSGWSRVEYNGEVLYVVTSLVQGVTGE